MKITNSDIIKSGERELIDSIIGDLDWDAIEEIVKNRHKLKIQDDVEYRQGDIVVHNNQVAYKLDFDVKMTLSVVFDRDGNYLSLVTSDSVEDVESSEEYPIAVTESDKAGDADADVDEATSTPAEESDGAIKMTSDEGPHIEEVESAATVSENRPDTDSPDEFSSDEVPSVSPGSEPKDNFSKMASHIAEMISEINDD